MIGADALSRWVDWDDRNTCILFGDGAGAMVLEAAEGEDAAGLLGKHCCFSCHSNVRLSLKLEPHHDHERCSRPSAATYVYPRQTRCCVVRQIYWLGVE